jgi:ketosteroid isomerase-like protein
MDTQIEKGAIEELLFSYRDALNASSVTLVAQAYTNDLVCMPHNAPTANGQKELHAAYEFAFKKFKVSTQLFIDEIEIVGDFAFARTHSKGTVLLYESGEVLPEENRELFVFHKVNGEWKIARYMFVKKQ